MRRRNREIQIFSVSALDLFASAMGVFALLAVILFPYYLKSEQQFTEEAQDVRVQNRQLREEIEKLMELLKGSYLVVVLQWDTLRQDVDMHVVDPAGNEFYYDDTNRDGNTFPGEDAFLTVDSRDGPGVEVWLNPTAEAGEYRILANLYDRDQNPDNPLPRFKVYSRDEIFEIPGRVLDTQREKVEMFRLRVDGEGKVSVLDDPS
jgi:hypothetical protein